MKVPGYDNFQTQVSGQPNVQAQTPSGPMPGAIAADQMASFGKAMSNTGEVVGKIAMDMEQQTNEVRVMDAVNRAKERMYDLTYNKDTGYSMQKGITALERPDGKDLAVEYTDKFQVELNAIASSLGNDAQRLKFQQHAGQMRTDMYGNAERHMSQEFTHYQGSVYDGAISNAQRIIATNPSDIAAVQQNVDSIEAAARGKARLMGLSQEFADTQVRKAVSNAHTLAIENALEKNDVSFADGYLKKFGKSMDADDLLRVQGKVTKEMDLRVADKVATSAVATTAPKLFNRDDDRAFNILIGTESGGRQFGKDGKPLTSSAGAIGIAQVMPTTGPEAAKMAGLKWDENRYRNDPEYNRALGKAYFSQQLKDFDGNLAQAYAAYNAGPGATRKAVAMGNARPGADWLTFLPQETQKYVAKNMGEYESGGGRFSTPTLADVHAQVRTQLGPDAKPQVVQAALQRSTQQFEDLVKAKTAKETEDVANAMRALVQNGGKYSQLPASLRGAIPPKEVDNVMNFGVRIAKGDDVTNGAVYLKLATDPLKGTGLTDSQFFRLRGDLSEADFKHFSNERALKQKGGGSDGPGELNTQAINDALKDRLRQLKIDPTPKDGTSEAEQLGTVHRFVRNEISEAQRLSGKKMTDVETAKFIDGLFAKNINFKTSIMGISTGGSSQALLSMKPGDIPGDIKDALKKDFEARGNRSPTDADLLGAYFVLKKHQPTRGATGSY